MRVLVAGRGWLAVRGAKAVQATTGLLGLDVTLEVARNRNDDGRDDWLPSLVALAMRAGWPVHDRVEAAALGPADVLMSLQHDRVVDCDALAGAAAYNLHFAALPRYRGSLSAALPVRHGEPTVGVTLHVLTPVVDAGPVIETRVFPLPAFTSAYELYREYHAHGFELLAAHLPDLLCGTVKASPQDETQATTFLRSAIDFADRELTDFDRDAVQVRNWCRSLIFPPEQFPTYRGREIVSCYLPAPGCRPHEARPPGTELYADADQVVVACARGEICLELGPLSADL